MQKRKKLSKLCVDNKMQAIHSDITPLLQRDRQNEKLDTSYFPDPHTGTEITVKWPQGGTHTRNSSFQKKFHPTDERGEEDGNRRWQRRRSPKIQTVFLCHPWIPHSLPPQTQWRRGSSDDRSSPMTATKKVCYMSTRCPSRECKKVTGSGDNSVNIVSTSKVNNIPWWGIIYRREHDINEVLMAAETFFSSTSLQESLLQHEWCWRCVCVSVGGRAGAVGAEVSHKWQTISWMISF